MRVCGDEQTDLRAGFVEVAALVREGAAGDDRPGVRAVAGAGEGAGVVQEPLQALLVFELGKGKRGGVADVGAVGRVELERAGAGAQRLAVAAADHGVCGHRREPAQGRTHGDVALEGGALGVVGDRVARLGAAGDDLVGPGGKKIVEPVEPRALGRREHAVRVGGVGVQRDRLVEQLMAAVDQTVGVFVARGEGELVVDELGRVGHQAKRAVGIGLGQRVARAGEPAAKPGKGTRGDIGRLAVERVRKAEAEPQVVLASRVVCHVCLHLRRMRAVLGRAECRLHVSPCLYPFILPRRPKRGHGRRRDGAY